MLRRVRRVFLGAIFDHIHPDNAESTVAPESWQVLGFTKTPSILFQVADKLQRPFLKELKEQLGERNSALMGSPIGGMLQEASFR